MSLRQAINDKCRDCIYDPLAPGNWRQQVTLCTSTECPLYRVRPTSRSMDRVTQRYGEQWPDVQRYGPPSEDDGQRKAPAATEAEVLTKCEVESPAIIAQERCRGDR